MSLLLSQLSGAAGITGTASLQQTPATNSASGQATIAGTSGGTQTPATSSASGTVSTLNITGTASLSQSPATQTASGSVPVTEIALKGGGGGRQRPRPQPIAVPFYREIIHGQSYGLSAAARQTGTGIITIAGSSKTTAGNTQQKSIGTIRDEAEELALILALVE